MKKDNKNRNLHTGEDQMGDGRYRFRYTDKYGKRMIVYSWKLTPTDKIPNGKKDDISLREKEQRIKKDLEDGIQSQKTLSVADLVKIYIDSKARIKNSTSENYVHMLEKNIKPSKLGRKTVSDVKKSDILLFYKYLYQDRNFAVGSIQLYQNLLFPAFQMAVDDKIIRSNPCTNCMKEYVRGSVSSNKNALTKVEQDRLLDYLYNESKFYSSYYTMVSLMLGTGMRIGETLGLTWDDIDLKVGVVSVNHQVAYRKKNGRFQHYICETKNNTDREIPLQRGLLEVLKKFKAETFFNSASCGYKLDGHKNFVFLNSNNKVFKPDVIVRAFHKLVEEHNSLKSDMQLPDFSPHILRHTFCTRMAENGCDCKVLQEIMGHKNIQITMQVYNHVNNDRATKEVLRLPDVLSV